MTITARDIMTQCPECIGENDTPVIDGSRLVGIIAESDIAQNAPADGVAETIDAVTES